MMAKHWSLGILATALVAAAVPLGSALAQQPAVPQSAAPQPAPAATDKVDAARISKGRDLFANWGCASCHSLVDADAHGDVGPHLDGADLTEAFITNRVTNGQGAMPSFGGQMTQQEVADIAYYIAHVTKK